MSNQIKEAPPGTPKTVEYGLAIAFFKEMRGGQAFYVVPGGDIVGCGALLKRALRAADYAISRGLKRQGFKTLTDRAIADMRKFGTAEDCRIERMAADREAKRSKGGSHDVYS